MRSLLRNNVFRLFLLVVTVAAAAQTAIWVVGAIEEHRTPPPVKATRVFLAALQSAALSGDEGCERALALLAASSRKRLETEARSMSGRHIRASACRTRSALFFLGLQPRTALLKAQTGGQAVVSIERHEADPKSFLIPGFWPTRSIVSTVEVQLIEEVGGWKVTLP